MDSNNMCADKDGFIPETIDSSKKCQVDDCSSFNSNSTELPMDSWINESDVLALNSEHDNGNSDLESELKKAEIELLAELEKVELEEKQKKEEHEAKYKSLLEEVERLKHSELQKDAKISELTELAKSLKRNLCSLYKTAKFEIERKDSLLQEAHKQLDRVLNQSRKVNVGRKYSHPCEASNLKEKSCSKNSSSHTNKSEASATVENSCNKNSSSNTDKLEGINPKENPCPKNSTSRDKTNNRKSGSHQRTVSIERDSSSRRDHRNHTKTSTSEAKSSHRDTYNHRSHYRHNSDSRKDTKHENSEKRKDHDFHHKSSTQPTHSDNNISSVQDKQRDSKCDERKLRGEKEEDHSSNQDSRHNLGKQTLQKDISKSSQLHINKTAQKMTKCEIQRSSTEKLALARASRKRSSSQNPSSHQDSRYSSEKQTFQKDMSKPAQSHINETSQKIKCETQEKSSAKLTLACISRKCSSSRNASPGKDSRHHSEKHTFPKNMSESAQVLMHEISQKTAESSNKIQEKCSEKLALTCTSRKRSLSTNASVQTDDELDGTSRDLTETNTLFYNILPNTLKNSFNEYEQKQITTLNKLKQSFVNYYIESQDRSKRSRTSFKLPCDFTADTLGVSSSEHLISYKSPADNFIFKNDLTCSEQFRSPFPEIGYMPKADDFFPDSFENQIEQTNSVGESTKTKMQIVTETEILEKTKKDILKLYRYQNSKVPFLVKRKFGLLNNSKKN